MAVKAPIKSVIASATGLVERVWIRWFQDIQDEVDLNTEHASSDGSSHTFIDQDVTITSSPTFTGLTVDGKDMIKWAVLQGG